MKRSTFQIFCLLPWAQKSLYLSTQSLWQSLKIKAQSIKLQVALRRQESQLSLKFGYKKQTIHSKSTVNNVHYGPDLIQIRTNHRRQILLKALFWTWNKVKRTEFSWMALTLIINMQYYLFRFLLVYPLHAQCMCCWSAHSLDIQFHSFYYPHEAFFFLPLLKFFLLFSFLPSGSCCLLGLFLSSPSLVPLEVY